MGKTYFNLLFFLYAAALFFCGGVRIVLELWYTDSQTGFYLSQFGPMAALFRGLLCVAIFLLIFLNRIWRTRHDYPLEMSSTLQSLLMLVCGASILLYSTLGMPETLMRPGGSAVLASIFEVVDLIFGVISGIAFLSAGICGLTGRRPYPVLMLFPSVWQLLVLISRFNGYNAPLFIFNSLLAILFMSFASLFFLGHARVVCGIGKKTGRNYVIPMGLIASLCGFLLVIPNFFYLILYRSVMPDTDLSLFEGLYVLLVSLYALFFVRRLCRSIQFV